MTDFGHIRLLTTSPEQSAVLDVLLALHPISSATGKRGVAMATDTLGPAYSR